MNFYNFYTDSRTRNNNRHDLQVPTARDNSRTDPMAKIMCGVRCPQWWRRIPSEKKRLLDSEAFLEWYIKVCTQAQKLNTAAKRLKIFCFPSSDAQKGIGLHVTSVSIMRWWEPYFGIVRFAIHFQLCKFINNSSHVFILWATWGSCHCSLILMSHTHKRKSLLAMEQNTAFWIKWSRVCFP